MAEPHLDDEQISALLDASGADDEQAHVAGCDECASRLDQLEYAKGLVAAAPAPLAADVVDDLVARALTEAGTVDALAPVVRLDDRRRRPAALNWIAAVAAVLVVLLAVPALMTSGDGNDAAETASEETGAGDDTSSDRAALTDSAESSTGLAAPAPATASAEGSADTKAAGGETAQFASANLGPVDSPEDLVRHLLGILSTGEQRSATEETDCSSVARGVGGERLGSLVYVSGVVWQGRDAEVVVFMLTEPMPDATRQAYVMARAGCAVLAEPRF